MLVGHLNTPHGSHLFDLFLKHIWSQDIRKLMKMIMWAPLHPIWQLIRGCQSRSSESDRTATPDPFRVLLPYHLDNGNSNNNNICKHVCPCARTHAHKHVRKHAHTHTRTAVTTPQKNRDEMSTIDGKSSILRGGWAAGCGGNGRGTGETDGAWGRRTGNGWALGACTM
jgi:hypothetical protein